MAGMDKAYMADLQTLLEAEAELKRSGTDVLVDPEYRALREQFIDGNITLAQLAGRIEALSATRPDEGEDADEGGDVARP